jgi:hypothetical protein
MDFSTRHVLSLLVVGGDTEYHELRKMGGAYGDH